MAPLGPSRPGPRRDQGELRRRGGSSRTDRHQFRRESDASRSRSGRARSPRLLAPARDPAKDADKKAEAKKLKSIGYVGSPTQRSQRVIPDWTHVNAVAYNAELDQIVISVHAFSEIWIIDHSTTRPRPPATPGALGQGGDLLYRWGNPRAYRAGTKADQKLFSQHNAHWIPRGFPVRDTCSFSTTAGTGRTGTIRQLTRLSSRSMAQGRYTLERERPSGPGSPSGATRAQEVRLLRLLHFGRRPAPQRQHVHLLRTQGHGLRGDAGWQVVWKYVNPMNPATGQKKRLKQMEADFARGGRPGGLPGVLARGPPGPPEPQPPCFPGVQVRPELSGLAGKVMKPGKTIEELQSHEPE